MHVRFSLEAEEASNHRESNPNSVPPEVFLLKVFFDSFKEQLLEISA